MTSPSDAVDRPPTAADGPSAAADRPPARRAAVGLLLGVAVGVLLRSLIEHTFDEGGSG